MNVDPIFFWFTIDTMVDNPFRRYQDLKINIEALPEKIVCQLLPPSRNPMSFIDESISTAKKVFSYYNETVTIPMSGVDSEALAESFRLAKITFRVAIFRYQDGFNAFDIQHAIKYCEYWQIKYNFIDINLDDFFQSGEHLEIAKNYMCRSPQLAVHLKCLKNISGPIILPHNPIALYNKRNSFYWEVPQFLYHTYDKFFKFESKNGIGMFFLENSELVYSYLSSLIYFDLVGLPYEIWQIYSRDPYLIKCEVYRQGGFRIWPKLSKATGFEFYREHLNTKHAGQFQHDYFNETYRAPMEVLSEDPTSKLSAEVDLKYLYLLWVKKKEGKMC